jgi:hypothetical protein
MAGFTSLPDTSNTKNNFYGLKYDPTTAVCQIEEILFGDNSVQIPLPALNDDGSFFSRSPEDYISTAVTPFEWSFSWDTTNLDQLIVEVN